MCPEKLYRNKMDYYYYKSKSLEAAVLDYTVCFCKLVVSFPLVMSTGGDDRRVLLWHMEQAIHARSKPVKLKGEHLSNIFCLAFDSTNKKVFSGGKSEEKVLVLDLYKCFCGLLSLKDVKGRSD